MISEENSPRAKITRLNRCVYRLGPLGSPRVLSSYLIVDDKIGVIDCGPISVISELSALIAECGVRENELDYLLLTHIHLDHAGGTASFLRRYPTAKVMIPERGYKYMLDPTALNASSRSIIGDAIFDRWGACAPVPKEGAVPITPNTKIDLGSTNVEYLPAPGHAPHHTVLKMSPDSFVFSADSMGILDRETNSIIPTTPPPSFDLPQAIQDISMIEAFGPKYSCIAHFEELEPTKSLYARIRSTYKKWSDRASEFIAERNLKNYDLEDCAQLFSLLVSDYPEYASLSQDLKEQAIRIDCAGMLNYHLRNASKQ